MVDFVKIQILPKISQSIFCSNTKYKTKKNVLILIFYILFHPFKNIANVLNSYLQKKKHFKF